MQLSQFVTHHSIRRRYLLATLFLFLIFLSLLFLHFRSISNTPRIALPMSSQKRIVVVDEDDYPPYLFRDEKNKLQGITVDLWKAWENHNRIPVDVRGTTWNRALQMVSNGEADVVATIYPSDARKKVYDFTQSYDIIDVWLFFDKQIQGISDLSSIRGFRVGAIRGDYAVDMLRQNGIKNPVCFDTIPQMIQAAIDHKIQAFVSDRLATLYYLYRNNVQNQISYSPKPVLGGAVRRAVRKGRLDLVRLIDDGFRRIPKSEIADIYRKWQGVGISPPEYLRYLWIGAAVVGGFLLLLVGWMWALRKAVRRSTASLQHVVNELQQSEDRFRALLQNSPDIVLIIQEGGLIRYASSSIERMMGYSPEAIPGTNAFDYIHASDRNRVFDAFVDLMDNPGEPLNIEFRVRHADGHWVYTENIGRNLLQDPTIGGFLVNCRDVTERRQFEEHQRQSQKLEAIGTLASGVAHDFNNILTAISGYTEMTLRDTSPDHAGYTNLHQVIKAVTRARDLVGQILAFSHQDAPHRALVSLAAVAEETVRLLRATLPTTIEIHLQVTSHEPTVWGDPTQLHQVLMNLSINAAQAMQGTGGILDIRISDAEIDSESVSPTFPQIAPGPYLLMSVQDTGRGIEQVIINRVFEPFFTTKETGQGTGMGLAVAHGIVTRHGGSISVQSELGKGTLFEVLLPRTESSASLNEEPVWVATQESARILLVDDEAPIVEISTDMLKSFGYHVVGTTKSAEAMELFRQHPDDFDLVITDQTMPGFTGEALATEFIRIRPDIPIIICTGYIGSIRTEDAPKIGIRGFLPKPFLAQDLAVAVQRALHPEINPSLVVPETNRN